MTPKELKEVIEKQQVVRKWLSRIDEKDEQIINEVMDLMRSNPEYRNWIFEYASAK